jgi:hypothetical protein
MKHIYIPKTKKNPNVIHVEIDISTVPSQDRKYSRLRNKAQVFDDRRYRKPKYKKNYLED